MAFFVVFGAVVAGWHWYLWVRLVAQTALPEPWSWIGTLLIAGLGASILGAFALRRLMGRRVADAAQAVVFSWMGFGFLLLALLVAMDVAWLVAEGAAYAGMFGGSVPADPTPARWIAGAALLGAAAMGAYAMRQAGAAAVRLERVSIPVGKLAGRPYRLVQISDLHVGPTIRRAYVQAIVDRANALDADAIVLTGDLVDGSVRQLAFDAEPLAQLRARDGVFSVTGNHEYYSGADQWIAWQRSKGIRVLRNECVAAGPVDIAGVDDWSGHGFGGGHGADVDKALAGRDTARPVVLLAHRPRTIERAQALGVDAQLSGHTHGGQLFPFNSIVKISEPYIAGLYRVGGAALYVSRGTGYWGPPMRLGAPAEITLVELTPAVP